MLLVDVVEVAKIQGEKMRESDYCGREKHLLVEVDVVDVDAKQSRES